MRDEREAKTFCMAFKRFDLTLAELLIIGGGITGAIGGLVAEHVIGDDGQFVSGGDDGLLRANLGALATVIGTQSGVGAQERDGG